jgi:dephospho-CoA kinase
MTVTSRAQPDTRTRRPTVIGLTGPIAAGKSTVAAMLQEQGAETIDADRVYHSLIQPQSPLWLAIVAHFGDTVLGSTMEIDRAALAKIVFADPMQLMELERLTHPAVVAEIRRRISLSSAPIVAVEAIKLVQSALAHEVDSVWLIAADDETRLRRLLRRDRLDPKAAGARIAASSNVVPEEFQPDITIDTSGGLDETRRAVREALHAMVESPS